MKRVNNRPAIWAIIVALLVYVGIIVTMYGLSIHNGHDIEQKQVQQQMHNITGHVEALLFTMADNASSYLSSYGTIDFTDLGYTRLILSDDDLRDLKDQEFATTLANFVNNNSYTIAAFFYFEPGVLSQQATQPLYHKGDSAISQINEHFNIQNSDLYRFVQQEKHNWWHTPNHLSSFGEPILVCCMPIFHNDTNQFVGVFVMDYALTSLNEYLSDSKPYEQSEIFVINASGMVISQSDSLYYGYSVNELPQWNTDVFVNEEVDFTYLPWKLRMYTPKKVVQATLLGFLDSFLLYGFIGLLILSICMAFAIRAIKKNARIQHSIESEIQMAGEVQKSLLPDHLPHLQEVNISALLRPAKDVAGDVYEAQQIGDYIYFMIGDVSGKGLQASMLMAMLSGLFRHEIQYGKTPAQIMFALNQSLVERNPATLFCTMLIGRLDTRTGECNICNAGHNPPVMCGQLLDLQPNMMLGILPDYTYQDEQYWLRPGDTLLCYTDGVTEAMNAQQELFGTNRLLQLEPQIDTIMQAIHTFSGSTEQSDDITMLTLCYTPWVMHSVEDMAHLREYLMNHTQLSGMPLAHTQLAIEEMAVNTLNYGQATWCSVHVQVTADTIRVDMMNDGDAFDPTRHIKETPNTDPDELQIGGQGISLVKNLCQNMQYERLNEYNHLTLIITQ